MTTDSPKDPAIDVTYWQQKALALAGKVDDERALRLQAQHERDCAVEQLAELAWRPIETAPRDVDALFWVVPLTIDDPHFVDTSGNPILANGRQPTLQMNRYGRWSSLSKATHWMPLPSPPTRTKEP